MSRLENTARNFVWSSISNLLTVGLQFVSRTIFINLLGATYLGVNGLFTNVLSMLSLTELGIGAAINFSLYKPLAENDSEKIKSLMLLYKKAYRYIALAVALIGLVLVPFLRVIVKGGEGIEHITYIYLIFLFNTSYSYLFTYRRTLLAADQKSYLITNINMIVSIMTLLIQIAALLLFKNYYVYLISGVLIGIAQNFYINAFIDKRYPYLLSKDTRKLPKDDISKITVNVKAMMLHKIGDLCVNQTDNIIISSFINVTVVGLVSNYTLILNGVNMFMQSFFNAANASLGNLIATENREKQLAVFNVYNFLAFWFFGWASVCLYVLINPFITLWLGAERVIAQNIINLVIINFFLSGMRLPLGNVKAAAGVYRQDKFVPLVQAGVNLIASIIGVRYLGLAGVFLGTIISSVVMPGWFRPMIVYKHVFHTSSKPYFIKYAIYAAVLILNAGLAAAVGIFVFGGRIAWPPFLIMCAVCLILPNMVIVLLFRKTKDFSYVMSLAAPFIRKVVKRR